MKKPCRGCIYGAHYSVKGKERWKPRWTSSACDDCTKFKKYQEYLKSRQKYERGKPITSINGLIRWFENHGFVYLQSKILHKGFVYSWQLHMIMDAINIGVLYEANLKQ